jgi:transcriptional regulator with PAS, ATPase and Fis domain
VESLPGEIVNPEYSVPKDGAKPAPPVAEPLAGEHFAEGTSLFDIEKQLLVRALRQAEGNQSKAAKILGISRDTLRYRIKKFNL